MNTADVTNLLGRLLLDMQWDPDPVREPIRVWAHSGVERLRWPDGASVVFKYADAPFDREPHALRMAARAGLPVPNVYDARVTDGLLVMLLEDLGEPQRAADDIDGAKAAIQLHTVGALPGLDVMDQAAMAVMPGRVLGRLTALGVGGYPLDAARALAGAAGARDIGAMLSPFGLVHAEFHPTSLHLGTVHGLSLLDFARAFTGPGLLDLASWHGTVNDPGVDRTHTLIESYVRAGGTSSALDERGGLDAATWALGWHRVWVADWYAQQIELGWSRDAPHVWTDAIGRHLREAVELLKP